jgi:hypothetical protein
MGVATTTTHTLSYVAVTVRDDCHHQFGRLLMGIDRYRAGGYLCPRVPTYCRGTFIRDDSTSTKDEANPKECVVVRALTVDITPRAIIPTLFYITIDRYRK